MDTIKLYLRSMRMLIRSQLQYPASFLMQTLAQLIMEGGEMLAVILIVLLGGFWTYRIWYNYQKKDYLVNLGTGQYQGTTQAEKIRETLPLPPVVKP